MSADRTIETNNGDVTIRGNIGGGQGLTIDAGTGAIALGSATGGLTGNWGWDEYDGDRDAGGEHDDHHLYGRWCW